MADDAAAVLGASRDARFAVAKFRPTTLPSTLVHRSVLHDRLTAGAGQRLTVVVGSAGAGKSVLLSSWAAARPPGTTAWLSCDRGDVNSVRFWSGFIKAPRAIDSGFGADATDLLAMDGAMSADVIASIANDAAELPAGSAIIVDDFHTAAPAVSGDLTDLVERWPAQAAQLVLASRSEPQLRLHRLRMTGELCELRNRDLCFSLAESRDLLANFGVEVGAGELALLSSSAARVGPRCCRWRRCRCAASQTRRGLHRCWMLAAARSPSTSSLRSSTSSCLRWPGSCSRPPSWGS